MNRKYPDIDFVETDAQEIVSTMIQMYEELTKKTLYPASPERLFISWCASVIIQQRVLINETAKKNVPRYADGEYLDSLAELFRDIERLPASKAKATFRCYISEPQQQSVFIPAGTRVTADGDIMFTLDRVMEIPAGSTYADAEGTCQTEGEDGNGFEAGQIKQIVDVYDYFQKIENITASSGGAEQESDEAFYERMRESMESFSTAGPVNSYIYHAKSVSAAVQDVVATSPTPGAVDVRVLLKSGTDGAEAVMDDIEKALNADNIRPLTDYVTVAAPETDDFEIDVTYYIPQEQQANALIIDADARAAVQSYIEWQTGKMGRDINPSQLTARLMETGVKRVEVTKPEFSIVEQTHIAKLTSSAIKNGGIESV